MAANNLAEFDKLAGTTDTYAPTNMALNSGAHAAPKAPGFWGQVGHTLATVPGQAAGAVYHATVDPFAHLIKNAQNAANAGSNAQSADDFSKALDKMSKQAKVDFAAGHITRDQYVEKLHGITQQATSLAQGQHENQVKSIGQMAPDAASAILTAATLGAGGVAVNGAKAGAEAVGAKVAGNVGAKVAGKIVQGGADLIGAGKGNIATKVIRNAALVQPTAQFAGKSAQDVAHGDLKAGAGDAALALAPAGLGVVAKGVKAVAPALRDAFLGKSATLTDAFGVNRITQYLADHANNPDNIAKLKRIEMFTENQPAVKSGKISAGEFLKQHVEGEMKLDPATTPIQDIVDNMDAYARNHEALQKGIEAGLVHPEAVITHGKDATIPTIAKEFAAHGNSELSSQTRVELVNNALDRMGVQNMTLRNKIGSEVLSAGTTGKEIAAALSDMKGKIEIPIPKGLLDSGYSATYGPKERAIMPSLEDAKQAGLPTVGADAKGVAGALGRGVDKLGLGLRTTPSGVTAKAVIENLNSRLEGTALAGRGKEIMTALHNETSKTSGVYDPRMLRATANGLGPARASVENALRGISGDNAQPDAKMVLKAVKSAYGDVPLGTRSLGEKVTDKLIQHISPMATYLKAQGYGKFSANPFFWVKQATKGEFIGQTETGGKALNLGRAMNQMLGTAPEKETINLLERSGLTSKAGAAGTEADALGTEAFGITGSKAQVNEYIKQSMGQAAEQFAKNNGTTVKELLQTDHPQHHDFNHLMEMIVGYPKGANYLNSNLAKSLNVLIFPSRFEAKVGMATAKYFMSQPKVVQLAMVNSLLRAQDWANSPEGQKFQKDNADLIGALNYFSPTHTLESIASFSKSGNAGDLGQVGGLPVGVITTILKHQGVKLPNFVAGEDINPATGQPYTTKVPTTDKARLQQGVQDLIGSMFAYPGATIGAPSKNKALNAVPGLNIASKDEKVIGKDNATTVNKAVPAPPTATLKTTLQTTPVKGSITPIYKSSKSSKVPHAKVHAIKPANSKI